MNTKRKLDSKAVTIRASAFWIVLILIVVATAWGTDFVTLEGERTVYTVECRDGNWNDLACSGTLVAGERYRFRALKAHREVLFWTVGEANASSGRFNDCTIANGHNWRCEPGPDAARTITREMRSGRPVHDEGGPARAFHAVSKWQWMLLRCGVHLIHAATI